VHGQELRASAARSRRARHRIADVVQAEIDENLLASTSELTNQRQSSGKSQLIADLVNVTLSPSGQSSRPACDAGRSSATINRRGERYQMAAYHLTSCAGKTSISLPHQRVERIAYRRDGPSTGPYHQGLRLRMDSGAGSDNRGVAGGQDQPQRRQRRAPPKRLSEAAAIAKARSRNTWRGFRAHPGRASPSRWYS